MLVEVCANSLQSAMNAEKAGADRIELCSELAVGGITPSYGLMKAVADKISIPVRVLIRPRSGDFTYTLDEIEIMKSNIKLCEELNFEGIVSGVLNEDFTLNRGTIQELISLPKRMKFTFHRAFDWVKNPQEALTELESLGVDTILTSGQQKKAVDGMELLSELQQKSSSCIIMPGSGINPSNANLFREKGFKAIHLSGTQMHQRLLENPKISMNSPKMLSDSSVVLSNFETIQEVVKSVK